MTTKRATRFCGFGTGLSSAARREAAAFLKDEGPAFIFAMKISLAMLLAMSVSMLLQLDRPSTAMITVVVVMQPQTGMVLAKSLYRIAATAIGSFTGLLLVALFAQERVLFLVGLALWVAICTACAAFNRNFRSYGCVLAGYTAALIALPAVVQPESYFSAATTRFAEIIVGIVCAGVVSDLIFPRRLSGSIAVNLESRFRDFKAFVRASLAEGQGAELKKMQLKVVSAVISLEALRSAAVLEDPEMRASNDWFRKLNSQFMAASTTFHSFQQLMKRLRGQDGAAGRVLISLQESVISAVDGGDATGAASGGWSARRIAVTRKLLARREKELAASLSPAGEPQGLIDFHTAVELLHRFLRELHLYIRTYAAGPKGVRGTDIVDQAKFAVHTDAVVAAMAAARAFLAILAVGLFWILSGWPHGISIVVNTAVCIALFAAAPDPPRGARLMSTGFCCGLIAGLIFKFLVMPSLDGLPLLVAAILPVLLAGSLLISHPPLGALGSPFLIFFSYITSPTRAMAFDPVDSVNDGIGTIVGIVVAGIIFAIFLPAATPWLQRRAIRALRRELAAASVDPLAGLSHRFDSATRDILNQQTAQKWADGGRLLMAEFFDVMELGHAIIHLRRDLCELQLTAEIESAVRDAIAAVAVLCAPRGRSAQGAALVTVANAIEAVDAGARVKEEIDAVGARRLLASLHLIRTALLDDGAAAR
jgi:uncharacterized membrane protein YccC